MFRYSFLFLVIALYLQACYLFQKSAPLPDRLFEADQTWIDETFKKMSLDHKIGQSLNHINPSAGL